MILRGIEGYVKGKKGSLINVFSGQVRVTNALQVEIEAIIQAIGIGLLEKF